MFLKQKNTKSPIDLDWKVSGSKVVFFEVQNGEEVFGMEAERFALLLDANYVKGQFEEVAQERAYPADWGFEKFVEAQRLLLKCLNLAQIAGLWGVPEPMVRAFYAQALQKFQHDPQGVRNEGERQGSSDTEKDYCLSLRAADVRMSEDPRPGQDFLEVPYVARLLKELGSTLAVASRMMLDSDDFWKWVESNKRYLALFGYKDNLL